MPYYVYRITERPLRRLDKIAERAVFREASAEAKRLRGTAAADNDEVIKVIFADNELQAEDLLSQVREPEPLIGDDY